MKKKITPKKLAISAETIKTLSSTELVRVAGAQASSIAVYCPPSYPLVSCYCNGGY